MLIADGVWWRRALDPQFKPETVVPMFMDVARHMLRARPKVLVEPLVEAPAEDKSGAPQENAPLKKGSSR